MNIGPSIRLGFAVTRRSSSAVAILFVAHLALAALAALPIFYDIEQFTARSRMGRELAGGFSVDWLADFSFARPGSFHRYAIVIVFTGMASLVLNSILAGGVLSRFRTPELKYSLREFFGGMKCYAWRFLRLLLIGLICYWVVFKLLNVRLGQWVEQRTLDGSDDRWVFAARLAASLLLLMGVGFVNLVMDYARVRLVLEDGTGAIHAFLASLGFSLGRFRKAAVVYLAPSLGGLALLGVYRLVFPWALANAGVSSGSPVRVGLALGGLFAVQQIVMFGRHWFRVATWASEWALYVGTKG